MLTKIRKWGNSLAIRIPRSFARETCIEAGSTVDLSVEDGELILRPVRKMYRLQDLLDRVEPENLHAEVETGEPVGRESW